MEPTPDSTSTTAASPSRWALAVQGNAEALGELAGSYWYCVYVWWRRSGLDAAAAAAATVASFTRWMTTWPPGAEDSGAGLMREWLPARLAELAAEGLELEGEAAIAIEAEWAEGHYPDEPEGEPEAVFHRRWTLSVLEFTMQALRAEYAARGLEALFGEVAPFVGFEGSDEARYAAAAERAGLTAGALKRAVFDFRTHHRELLRSIVADTVADPADIDSEITALLCACDLPGAADAAPAPLPTAIRTFKPEELLARAMNTVHMTSGGMGKWKPPSDEEVARLFPQFEMLGMIGRGGMGAVYRARQVALDREVAIKLLPLEVSVDQAFADRFVREARAMAKLSHPNIISVFDFGTTGEGHLFFVMEYVEGANVSEIIRGPGLGPEQAVAIAGQVCTALAYAHGRGVVHRDIKPANVMVGTDGTAKVADFGLARVTGSDPDAFGQTVTGTIMGTPEYMAPEQKRGMAVDHRADIYSVGVMLYEMLCKEPPQGAFEPPSQRAGCDARLDQIVLKAMHRTPEGRYQSTTEMKLDLDAARTPLPVAPRRHGVPPPRMHPLVPPPKKSHAGLIAFLVAALLVAGAIFYVQKNKDHRRTSAQPPAKATQPRTPAPLSTPAPGTIGAPVPVVAGKPETMPGDVPRLAVPPAEPLTGPKDLLAGVEVARDAVKGEWKLTPEGLLANTAGEHDSELLGFNFAPPEEYDFEIEFTIQGGLGEVNQVLPVAGRSVLWKMGYSVDDPTFFSFGSTLDGNKPGAKTRTEALVRLPRLKLNQRYRSVVEVRRDSLRALLDGEEVLRWSGDFQRFESEATYRPPDLRQLGLAAWKTPVLFHKAVVRPPGIANLAAVPRSASGWTDLLGAVDVKRDAITGEWLMENGELVSAATTHCTLELPVAKAPLHYDLRYRMTLRKGAGSIYFAIRSGNAGEAFFFDESTNSTTTPTEVAAHFLGGTTESGTRAVKPRRYFDALERHELLVQVREDRVTISLDGNEVLNRKGGLARLNQADGYYLRAGQRSGPVFAVGSYGEAVFHSIEMKPQDTPIVAAAPAASDLVAASNDPRLAKLEAAFKARFDSDAQKPYLASIAALNQSYLANGVARLRVAAQAKGNLDEVTALDAEKAAIDRGDGVPATDDAGTPEALKVFRSSYRMAMTKYNADRAKTAGQLYDMYLASLDGYVAELTRANKIDEARKVKTLREEVAAKKADLGRIATAEPPKPATPAGPKPAPTTGSPAAGSPAAGNMREAAKWLVANGGTCRIAKGTLETEVETEKEIPVGKFEILGLTLIRRPTNLPPLTDADSQVFRGIKTLRTLSIRLPGVGDEAFAFLADSPDLSSVNFDSVSDLTDGVLPYLASAKKLTAFVLTGAKRFTGKGLDKMRWLPALTAADFLGCGIGDDGVKALAAAPKLNSLRISSASSAVTDAGLAAIATHPALTDLNLDLCTGPTDTGFAALRGLKSLSNLGASGTGFGDGAAAAIASHPGLRQLNLSNTPLTDAGLAKLTALTKLQTLNVRDSKVTPAGVEAFKKAVPKCLVIQ